MKKIKYLLILSIFIIFCLGVYNVYDLNKRIPNPKDEEIKINQEFRYAGFDINVLKYSVMTKKELYENYKKENIILEYECDKYKVVDIEFTPSENYDRKINIQDAMLDIGNSCSLLCCGNIRDLDGIKWIEVGQKREISLIYGIEKGYHESKDDKLKLVFDYYPTYKYVLLSQEEKDEN